MKLIRILLLGIVILPNQIVWTQEDEIHHNLESDSSDCTTNIREIFLKGHTEGHIRSYFMTTINHRQLYDYWANAIGGSLGYHTAIWRGFQIGVKGIFTYNLASSDLNQVDPVSGESAKWEKELFDITRPEERKDLDRLEELYIKYHYKNSFATFGKIDINEGPLLLKRDGRMKPFAYKGGWFEFNEIKNQSIKGGFIYAVSPRGMTEWYELNEAIGILNNGAHQNYKTLHYHEHAQTEGLSALGFENKSIKNLNLTMWHYYLHQVYHTIWSQADFENDRFFTGFQYVHQFADTYQSTLAIENRYFQPDEESHTISTQIGFKSKENKNRFSAAYLHGFNSGKFLFPRELSRENFYVSQPRSWVDGLGGVDIYMLRAQIKPTKQKFEGLSTDFRIERVQVSKSPKLNKYQIPSYFQSTLIAKYNFQDQLSGLYLSFLYAYRFTEQATKTNLTNEFYNTNFHHINLILNIIF